MAFTVELTQRAIQHLEPLRKFDQRRIRDAIGNQLLHQPLQESRNRKRLRPNRLAEWELRVGSFRIFYDVNEPDAIVKVVGVGYKEGNKVFIQGEEVEL